MNPARKLIHEVWEDQEEDGQWLPGICLAGPRGDDFRASQSKQARLIARTEAASHFEAMTQYHNLLGREPYAGNHERDHQTYPETWFVEQAILR